MDLLRRHLWMVLLPALAAAGCAIDRHEAQPVASGNLLENASFEQGRAPWFVLATPNWEDFEITDQYAAHGRYSARLALRGEGSARSTKIAGVIQEVSPREFPRRLSGSYRIEGWTRGTAKQYVQVVVIVFGNPGAKPFPNHQIRYVLAGVDKPPLRMVNARYSFVGGSELQEGRWARFDLDLHADFQRLWGYVPKEFSKIRVLFEVRYDEKKAGEGAAAAHVYFDDLYLAR